MSGMLQAAEIKQEILAPENTKKRSKGQADNERPEEEGLESIQILGA